MFESRHWEVVRGTNNKLRDGVLLPLLESCDEIWRASGYFSSGVFELAPQEWRRFFVRGGELRLVCSPLLGRPDLEAIIQALEKPKTLLEQPVPTIARNKAFGQKLLAWGLANSQIHIQLARVTDNHNAIYHEKFGVGFLAGRPQIAFSGSVNETYGGYSENFELAHVDTQQENLPAFVKRFAALWSDNTQGLDVFALHKALALGLVETKDEGSDSATSAKDSRYSRFAEVVVKPASLKLRDYQKEAIARWFDAGGIGIYEMATGTGKTITSLATALRLYKHLGGPLAIVVVAPYLVLVDQWAETMAWFGLQPIKCSGGRDNWESDAHNTIRLANRDLRQVVSLVASNATFASDAMQTLIKRLEVPTLIIADEVHNFGADNLSLALPERVSMRLGLSATPERFRDERGSTSIRNYFGDTVFEFSMRDAMEASPPALVSYDYHPVKVALDSQEYERYADLSARIARAMSFGGEENSLPEPAKKLLIARARLIAGASQKLELLKRSIEPYRSKPYSLVYCGDGRLDTSEDNETEAFARQIDEVVRMLSHDMGMNAASYTSRTSKSDREALLSEFREGRIQVLVAIRCLDEGVDIPEIRRAFVLASSTNPRQFIQRRGRVLRTAPGKEKAEIFDFFVVPPEGHKATETDRNLVKREMSRAREFLKLASNETEARHELWNVLERLHLLDTLVERDDGR